MKISPTSQYYRPNVPLYERDSFFGKGDKLGNLFERHNIEKTMTSSLLLLEYFWLRDIAPSTFNITFETLYHICWKCIRNLYWTFCEPFINMYTLLLLVLKFNMESRKLLRSFSNINLFGFYAVSVITIAWKTYMTLSKSMLCLRGMACVGSWKLLSSLGTYL